MNNDDILKYLQQDIHTVIMASNDEDGHPITCAIDLMLYEEGKLYFLTAKGKAFYRRLTSSPFISLTGLQGESTMTSIAISLQGKIRNIGKEKLSRIFQVNSYMNDIYPTEVSREALEVFEVYVAQGEYFDLSQKPILRQSFYIGKQSNKQHGYFVNDRCIGCGMCIKHCPQNCIDMSLIPVMIKQKHCLHCGNCMGVCPMHAIDQY